MLLFAVGCLDHETAGTRIRRETIECIWMHILMIHIDTKGLILKKAGE